MNKTSCNVLTKATYSASVVDMDTVFCKDLFYEMVNFHDVNQIDRFVSLQLP